MANTRTQRRENELPYIPFGPFQIRLPFIHYKIESVEFIQGLILGVTALAAVPYLEQYLGLPYELAWSCVIIETFLYLLHSLLGDPVVPGWITPTLPLTIVFLEGFPMGKERIQAMIALQMLVGLVFIFMGVTRLADKFVHAVPNSVKGGILLAAPVTVMAGQLGENGNMHKYPLAIVAGVGLLILISFSDKYQEKRKTNKFLDLVARYGNLFPYLIAMVVGLLVGELDAPGLEIGTFIKIPQFKDIIDQVSIFGVGIPPASMFIKALPLALVCYVIAFGDFVTTETLVSEARQARDDEYIDFNSSRSNLVSGLRNLILSIIAPFPPLSGPLWVGMTVSVSMRYKEGYEVSSRRNGFLQTGHILKCADHSCSKLLSPDLRSRIFHYSDVPGICMCENWYGLLQERQRQDDRRRYGSSPRNPGNRMGICMGTGSRLRTEYLPVQLESP